MAHYAILDYKNIVIQVIVGKDENELDNDGNIVDWEKYYGGLRTSYNTYGNKHNNNGTPFRGNYAGPNFYYDNQFDAFIPPEPFPSWKINYETFLWEPPIPILSEEDGFIYKWSEQNQEWIKVVIPQA
jgi:hypothetical protein